MILLILQLAVLIISTVHVYKTAKSSGRHATFWSVINVVVVLGIPFVIGIVVGFGMVAAAGLFWIDVETLPTLFTVLGFVGLGIGLTGTYLILKHVSISRDDDFLEPPPDPEFFDLK